MEYEHNGTDKERCIASEVSEKGLYLKGPWRERESTSCEGKVFPVNEEVGEIPDLLPLKLDQLVL